MAHDTPKTNAPAGAADGMAPCALPVELPLEQIAELCRRYQAHELALFGSVSGASGVVGSNYDYESPMKPSASTVKA